jgi:alcohol dehydrogenase (cytochrome c)
MHRQSKSPLPLTALAFLLGSVAAPLARAQPPDFMDLLNGLKNPTRWLMYSGDYFSRRYSPLTQLTPANVARLTAQWTFQTDLSPFMSTGRSGGLQSVPLVLDGIIYFAGTHNRVWAIDARTGRQIWQYQRSMPADVPSFTTRGLTRGISVLHDRLFLGTLDAHLVALDIKTGKVIWDREVEDYRKYYSITSAPLVISDRKVVVGIGGADRGAHRYFLDAYDTISGERIWRFFTTPAPGEPGADTWPNAEAMERGGGSTWTLGSYDPDLNLIYWGTGNPSGPGDTRPGDNLYTCSLAAIDGDTGKLHWYYQIVPHDIHDYDASQIPVLADVKISGQLRKVVLFAPKIGYLYVLDRENGKFITAHALVKSATNWAREIRPDGRPALIPEDGTRCLPDIHGGTNYWPPSFDPAQNLFFVTVHEVCQIFNTTQPGKVSPSPGNWSVGGPGYAVLSAIDPSTGQKHWEYRFPPSDFGLTGVSPNRFAGIALSGGVTSTASGLLFTGDNEGNFIAFDSHRGKPLWHYQTGSPVWGSAPVTYMLDGKQHVLISSGLTLMDFAISGP